MLLIVGILSLVACQQSRKTIYSEAQYDSLCKANLDKEIQALHEVYYKYEHIDTTISYVDQILSNPNFEMVDSTKPYYHILLDTCDYYSAKMDSLQAEKEKLYGKK